MKNSSVFKGIEKLCEKVRPGKVVVMEKADSGGARNPMSVFGMVIVFEAFSL